MPGAGYDADYDVAVIGGGPAGYAAAIAAAQAGLRAACIERRESLGGTCLNVGCIPSKTLLHWSARYREMAEGAPAHGITVGEVSLDLAAAMAGKDRVVAQLASGVAHLFAKNKVERIAGRARLAGRGVVAVTGEEGQAREIRARNIVIATGSEPIALSGVAIDERRVVSSAGALALPRVPKTLAVIGGGYIGLELGSVWSRFGAEVTVIEYLDRLAAGMDSELADRLRRALARQGVAFRLATRVAGADIRDDGVALSLAPAGSGGAAGGETLTAEIALVAVGRRPCADGLGIEEAGVALDERGSVMVDERYRTTAEGIYAIGDVIPGPMLAHKATAEARALADILAGGHGAVNYDAIPAVVYTEPEAASVGRTEDELKAAGTPYRKGTVPLAGNSRAKTIGQTAGFVKILSEKRSDRLLGVHILAPGAGALIAEAALALEFGASAEDIARTCHAHPTLNESLMEAASLAAFGNALHA